LAGRGRPRSRLTAWRRITRKSKGECCMKETIGFIGLGGMGLGMATNLLKAGFGLRVYNRTAEKARPLLELGARRARSPAEAAEPGGVVVTMVSDDRALEEVTLGTNGLLGRLGYGVHRSMSTIAPRTARPRPGVPRAV